MNLAILTDQTILKLLRQSPLTLSQIVMQSGTDIVFIARGITRLEARNLVKVTELTYSLTDEGRTLAEQFAGEWDAN